MIPSHAHPHELLDSNSEMHLLADCNWCAETFKDEDMVKTPEGQLCEKCNELYCEQEAENLREKKAQEGMRHWATDELETLVMLCSIYYEGLADKNNCENAILLRNRAQDELDTRHPKR